MIKHIGTVGVYVVDQKKALEFYTRKLGFEIRKQAPMGPDAEWLEVAPPKGESCLVIFPRSMMPGWENLKPSVVFSCDDLEATYQELSKRGVNFTEKPTKTDWGGYAKFTDPDGNEFVLV